jgi:hypothetical protein
MVLNLHGADAARNALDNFILNAEVLDAIEWFQPDQGETVEEHLQKLHTFIEQDTGIWGQHACSRSSSTRSTRRWSSTAATGTSRTAGWKPSSSAIPGSLRAPWLAG